MDDEDDRTAALVDVDDAGRVVGREALEHVGHATEGAGHRSRSLRSADGGVRTRRPARLPVRRTSTCRVRAAGRLPQGRHDAAAASSTTSRSRPTSATSSSTASTSSRWSRPSSTAATPTAPRCGPPTRRVPRAWDTVERLWAGTVERARAFPPEQLHESVDGEWSFIETLRHLAFATDAWVRRGILGDPAPWDPLDLPWDQMATRPACRATARCARRSTRRCALRHDRMATVRHVVDGLTAESLAARHRPGRGPRLAAAGELPGARVPAHRPQRGVPPPAVRRARPRRDRGAGRLTRLTPGRRRPPGPAAAPAARGPAPSRSDRAPGR